MRRAAVSSSSSCVAAIVVAVVVIAAWIVVKRKLSVHAVSIPEALHALTHGDEVRRSLAAVALCSILYGEVTVLEELLDEVKRKHGEFGRARADKRSLLDVAVEDAVVRGSRSAEMLLLAITERDERWDDDDEWNSLTADTLKLLLSATPRLERRRDEPQIAALLARIAGTADTKTPPGFSLHDEQHAPRLLTVPDVLPFNTRVMCAECGKALLKEKEQIRCRCCNNVAYCSRDHALVDAQRHAFWCRGILPSINQ